MPDQLPDQLPDVTWFRRPGGDGPGTTNLCYNAVDRHVIGGRAEEVALSGPEPVAGGALLELVGAVAGAFRGLGLAAGATVAVTHGSARTRLVCLLAAARVGAVAVVADASDTGDALRVHRPALWVTDRLPGEWSHRPAAVLLDGPEVDDPARDVAWEVALRAGRTDPAGCVPVAATAAAYVVAVPGSPGARTVTVAEALAGADGSELGLALADLVAGRAVDA